MVDRDEAVALIRGAYDARTRGDKEALAQYFAESAHFEIAGDAALLEPVPVGAARPMKTIGRLIEMFAFSDVELLDAVVEGRSIAARWKLKLTAAGRQAVETQLFDLIELDQHGKIRSMVQFADTALVRQLAQDAATTTITVSPGLAGGG
jgi:ketosteroid isomerase-like protein